MLKGASLLYAVFLCTIIATLCGVLLFVFSVSRLELNKILATNDFVANSISCFDQLPGIEINNLNGIHTINEFDVGSCEINSTSWGLLRLLKQKVFFKKDTLVKNVFAGVKQHNNIALYKADLGNPLKFSGLTKINGEVFIPNGRIERATILGNQSINNPQIFGAIKKSKQQLPDIVDTNFKFPQDHKKISLEDLNSSRLIINGFSKPTLVIYTHENQRLEGVSLKGNIVLVAENFIELTKDAILEDVIVVSPKVKISSGFIGSVQVYANESIFVDSSVELKYPSNLILNSSNTIQDNITISKKSTVYGNVILNTNAIITKKYGSIMVENDSSIYGNLYCKGQLQLMGMISGSVYTNHIVHKTKYSEYSDLLLNVTINTTSLNNDYVSIPLLKNNKSQPLGIIKEL